MRKSSGFLIVTVLLVSSLLLFAGPAAASTILIKPDGTGDYPTIQDGLNNSANNDTLLLAPGTYTGAGNRDLYLNFGVTNLTIASQSGAASTIMDCGGGTGWLTSFSSFTETTSISGVTIENATIAINLGGATDVFDVTIEDCIFDTNHTGFTSSNYSPIILRNNIFRNHINAGGNGSAITINAGTSVLIENNVFENNSARLGGAVFTVDATITGNVFAYNTATIHGGAIYANGTCQIVGNTFVANDADLGSGAFYLPAGTIANNIIAFSATSEAMLCFNSVVTCNNVFGNGGGDTLCSDDGDNISVDPGFCGVLGSGNYQLQSTSACAPANSPCGSLIGALPVGCGTVSVEQTTWTRVKDHYRD